MSKGEWNTDYTHNVRTKVSWDDVLALLKIVVPRELDRVST